MARRTEFEAGSTTETVFASILGTHSAPSIQALASGFAPTTTVAFVAMVAGSIG